MSPLEAKLRELVKAIDYEYPMWRHDVFVAAVEGDGINVLWKELLALLGEPVEVVRYPRRYIPVKVTSTPEDDDRVRIKDGWYVFNQFGIDKEVCFPDAESCARHCEHLNERQHRLVLKRGRSDGVVGCDDQRLDEEAGGGGAGP